MPGVAGRAALGGKRRCRPEGTPERLRAFRPRAAPDIFRPRGGRLVYESNLHVGPGFPKIQTRA